MSTDDKKDDILGGLEDWDDLFDSLHEPESEAEAEAELEKARARERELLAKGERVLDTSQYVFESDAGIEVEVEGPEEVAPEPAPQATAPAPRVTPPAPPVTPPAPPVTPPAPPVAAADDEVDLEVEEIEPVPEQPEAEEATPVPQGAPVPPASPAALEQVQKISQYADPMLTKTGVGAESTSGEEPDESELSVGTSFEPSGDELEDLLDFDSNAEALGDLLGAPPPLPPPEESGPVEPLSSEELAEEALRDDLLTSAPVPSLAPAPTDEELFGDLPEELPEEVAPVAARPQAEATRVVDPLALGDLARATAEPAPIAVPKKRAPTIVRREDLERKRREEESEAGDFGGGESTRIADAEALDDLARSEAEAARAAAAAAEAFFAEEQESLDLELDDDFYADIEIGGEADDGAAPEPVARPTARRRTAHIVRRQVTEPPVPRPSPASPGPVVEIEADFEDEGEDEAAAMAAAKAADSPFAPEEARVATGTIDHGEPDAGDSASDVVSSALPPPIDDEISAGVELVEEAADDEAMPGGGTSTDWPVAGVVPGASALADAAIVPTVSADDGADELAPFDGLPDMSIAEPEPTPVVAEEEPARASTADEVAAAAADEQADLAEVDVAPELPEGKFGSELPGLDPAALSFPDSVDPLIEDRTEEYASQLLVYERELENLDDPAATARLRIEAGRLAERLGDLERARSHYDQALVADPRAVPAMRGLRRVERSAGDWGAAIAALDAQLPYASKLEQRALAAHRADLLMAAGEQDLARVAVGELLDSAPSDVRALLASLELAFVDGRTDELPPILDKLSEGLEDVRLAASLSELRGRLADKSGDRAAAKAAFERTLDALPGALSWPLLRLALAAGDAAAAQAAWPRMLPAGAVEADPAFATAVVWRQVLAARRAGDDAVAAASLAAAGDEHGEPVLAALRARVADASGDHSDAARAWIAYAGATAHAAQRAAALRRAANHLAEVAPGDAAEALRRVIAEDPGDAASAASLEVTLASAGDSEALIEIDRRAVAADPGADLERLRMARRLVGLGRHDEAADQLRAGIAAAREAEREPSQALVDALAGVLALTGDAAGRAALLEREADGAPDPLVGRRRAAQALEQLALQALAEHQAASHADEAAEADSRRAVDAALGRALEAWQQVIELDAEDRSAHVAACRIAEALGDPDILETELLAAQAAEPHPAGVVTTALRRVALLLGRAEPDVGAAEDVLREAEALAPGDPRTTLPQVVLAAGGDRWAEAAQVLEERASSLGDTREAHALRFRAAAILLDRGDEPARAAELLGPLVAGVPGFAAASELQAAAHRRLGDASALAEDLDRATGVSADVEGARGDAFALLVREAELYELQVGDPARAVDVYTRALELRPDDPLARDGFVRAAAAAGEAAPVAELALADLKRAEELGDGKAKADAYEELARIDAELRGDHGSALLSWEAAVRADPSRHTALRVLEQTYLREGRPDDLLQLYGSQLNALDQSADAVGLAVMRARLAEQLGRSDAEVLANYRRAYEGDRGCRLALFRLEVEARARGASDELAGLEEAISSYYADDPVARASFLTRAGETRFQQGHLDRAVATLKLAADAVEGGHWPAHEAWRWVALSGELWTDVAEAAQGHAQVAATDAERARLYHFAGVALMDKALTGERAVEMFRKVLAVDPSHTDAYLRLRILFDEQGQHEDLAQLLDHRLSVEEDKPKRVELLTALAELHRNFLDDRDAAVDHLQSILDIDPDNKQAVASLSDIAWEKGDWPTAAETLIQRARLEQDPGVLKNIFYRLGTIYTDRLPDPKFAMRSFQKVLSYDPNDHGALDKLSEVAVELGDWKNALAACERLIKSASDPATAVPYWHRVAEIYQKGFDNKSRAEQALRRALDLDPTSEVALDKLVGFYEAAGETLSMKIHLDQVAAAMRRRIGERGLDPVAFRVIARVLEAREKVGAKGAGSLATARCAAELAQILGGAGEREQRLAAHAAQVKPPVAVLTKKSSDVDSLLFPRAVATELRQVVGALGDRLDKHVGIDLKKYGVGRGERQRGTEQAEVIAEVAAQMGLEGAEVYISQRNPRVLVAEPTGPISYVIGAEIMDSADAAALRFIAGRGAKLVSSSLAVLARLSAAELGVLVAALVRQFSPEFTLKGVPADQVEAEQQRMRRLIPSGMQLELRPFVLGLAGGRFDHVRAWQGIVAAGNRAGLLASGSVAASVGVLSRAAGHADLSAAVRDPLVGDLIRFSVSEEHAELRGKMGG